MRLYLLLLCGLFLTGCHNNDWCDVGNTTIVGDYDVLSDNRMIRDLYDRDCAIRDCAEFNRVSGDASCVV